MVETVQLIKLALGISVLLLVLGLGMRTRFGEALSLFRNSFQAPYSLLRAVIAMNVIVPIIAAGLALIFDLSQSVKVALVAMSIAPVPPVLPGKQLKFGGRQSFVFGLLVAVSLIAILVVPLSVQMLGWIFQKDFHIGLMNVAKLILKTVLLPLGAGIAIHEVSPALAAKMGPWIARIGTVLLLAALVPLLIYAWPSVMSLTGDGSVIAIAALVVSAILAGHITGGPDADDRTALGIVSAMRHPGVALAIATTNFPEDKLLVAAILLFVIVAVVATTLYGKLRLRRTESPAHPL